MGSRTECVSGSKVGSISAQAMHQMVAVMERKGLIRREVSPHHRKQLRILLTDHGLECLRQCEEFADNLEERMFADLSADEQRTLAQLLRRCSVALTLDQRVSAR